MGHKARPGQVRGARHGTQGQARQGEGGTASDVIGHEADQNKRFPNPTVKLGHARARASKVGGRGGGRGNMRLQVYTSMGVRARNKTRPRSL